MKKFVKFQFYLTCGEIPIKFAICLPFTFLDEKFFVLIRLFWYYGSENSEEKKRILSDKLLTTADKYLQQKIFTIVITEQKISRLWWEEKLIKIVNVFYLYFCVKTRRRNLIKLSKIM